MSLTFGNPVPPKIQDPHMFAFSVLIGLAIIMFSTLVVDKLGTVAFKKGFAKPFYIKGHRIHHSCIYFVVPALYGIMVALFSLGYVQPIWSAFWDKIAFAFLLVAATLAFDFIGDKYWPKIRMNVILHHEWIYAILPAYVFTYVINVII
ncbi:MAG: hypothetical protein OK457_05565 [Thaumarchaeota archaeon]|nr:hypothetical protein [Nitrososphaerota archaeon]